MLPSKSKSIQYRRDPNEWLIEKLWSWGKWSQLDSYAYGRCALTFDEIRVRNALQAYIPVLGVECEQTDRAIAKQPKILRQVAVYMYVDGLPKKYVGQKLKVSERHATRLHESLLAGIKYCLENPKVVTPPPQILLQRG